MPTDISTSPAPEPLRQNERAAAPANPAPPPRKQIDIGRFWYHLNGIDEKEDKERMDAIARNLFPS